MNKISVSAGLWLLICGLPVFACAEQVTLQETWVSAYQNNPGLEAERAKLRATDEQVAIALSHWHPTIEANGTLGKTYQYLPAERQFGTADFADTSRSAGVQVTQPIFRGFRTLSETESAKKQVMAGRAQLQAAEQQLLMDTAKAFLDIVRDEAILSFNRENENVLKSKLKETTERARIGDQTQTDVQQAESRIARAEVTSLQAENSLVSDRDAFMRLAGVEPGTLKAPQLALDEPKELKVAVHQAEILNPNVVAAQYAMEGATADIDQNKGALLPELDLVGNSSRNYGQSTTLPGRYDNSQVLLQLTVPLYKGGEDYARVRGAQQTQVQRRMELEDARHKAVETARNAWQTLLTTDAAIKADKREIEATDKALTGVRVQNHVGTRTTLDVLNAEQEALDAKTDLARSGHDRNMAILQIKAAIGELTADALKLPLEAYDPRKHYDNNHAKWIGMGGADDDIYAKSAHKDNSDN